MSPARRTDSDLVAVAGPAYQHVQRVAEAIKALDPQSRARRWRSLSYCVIDATWSIGARYYEVVAPLTRQVATALGDTDPLASADRPLPLDPAPLPLLCRRFPTTSDLVAVTNTQRVYSRTTAPWKAEIALAHARILIDLGVTDLHEAQRLLHDDERFSAVDAAVRRLPGEGRWGIRRGYLWMLCGDDETVKPDRMVLRWLASLDVDATPAQASAIIALASRVLTATWRPTTPWEADHAIWRDQRAQRLTRARRRGGVR